MLLIPSPFSPLFPLPLFSFSPSSPSSHSTHSNPLFPCHSLEFPGSENAEMVPDPAHPFLSYIDTDPTNANLVQFDGWLIVPANLTCVTLQLSVSSASVALFAGPNAESMSLVMENTNGLTAAATVDGMLTLGNINPVARGICGYRQVRIRILAYDAADDFSFDLLWNLGFGSTLVKIPSTAFDGVRYADETSDPKLAEDMINVTRSVIIDANGNYFQIQDDATSATRALLPTFVDPRKCEILSTNVATASCTTCNQAKIAKRQRVTYSAPVCTVSVVRIFNYTAAVGTGVDELSVTYPNTLTAIQQQNYLVGFPYDVDILKPYFKLTEKAAPPTLVLSTTLGSEVHLANDQHYNIFDGWLLVPLNITCIKFHLGNGSFPNQYQQASALWAGVDEKSMVELGSEFNNIGDPAVAQLTLTADYPVIAPGLRWVRIRLYDYNSYGPADSRVRWDLGQGAGFEAINVKYLFPASAVRPDAVTSVAIKYALLDANGDLWEMNSNLTRGTPLDLDLNQYFTPSVDPAQQPLFTCTCPAGLYGPQCRDSKLISV